MRVCLVTEEFAGLTPGGGIGTCFAGLGRLLAARGYQVEVLVTSTRVSSPETGAALAQLRQEGIEVCYLCDKEDAAIAATVPQEGADNIIKSYRCYRYLESQQHDVVHFHDYLGLGFYTAMARRQGLLRSTIITQTHGSSEWVRRYNLYLPDLGNLETEALERSQIELSDLVVSPSRYMLDWYQRNGVRLPKKTEVISWVLPIWLDSDARSESLSTSVLDPGVQELVYFGRHERRKGLEIFVEAIRMLKQRNSFDITFLGRFDSVDREHTGGYILRRLQNFPGRLRFLNGYHQARALRHLQSRPQALCVLPSVIENSPCAIGEVLSLQTPFIASDVGGTSELIAVADRDTALFSPEPAALAQRISEIDERGLQPVSSALIPSRIMQAWETVHEQIGPAKPPPRQTAARRGRAAKGPLVSICLVHHERPRLLARAVEHLLQQTYPNTEIIIVDDGSQSVSAMKVLDDLEARHGGAEFRVIRSANRYLGVARNLAASVARGDYLMFHDDDNVAEADEIETFVQAALSGDFEILTAQSFVFKSGSDPSTGKIEFFPIGIGGAHSFFANRFGDANALVSRAAFDRVGGFTELHGVGWEDWEFFLKAYLKGIRIGIVPRPLFRYHSSADGMLATGSSARNNARIFDAVRELAPILTADILQMARRDEIAQQILDKTWGLLGSQPFGYLHQELMALDPNSDEARSKLVDLAFHLGRLEDAVELGLGSFSMRDQLYRLLEFSTSLGERKMQLMTEPCVVLPDRIRAYEIDGWLTTRDLEPLGIRGVRIGNQRFAIESHETISRGDVAVSFGQPGTPFVGFRLTIVEAASSDLIDVANTTDIALASAGHAVYNLQVPIMLTVDGEHDPPAVKGCIERLAPICRRLLSLPRMNGLTGRLEFVLEPQPQEGRIVCRREASPLIDLGEGRFEAFSSGINFFTETDEAEGPLLALYSKTELAVVEAVAYCWSEQGKARRERPAA